MQILAKAFRNLLIPTQNSLIAQQLKTTSYIFKV